MTMPPTPADCPGPDHCGPVQNLYERIGTLESSVRILATGHVTLTQQMAELTISAHRQDERMDAFGHDLVENSQVTRETLQAAHEIKDIVTTGKTMGKLAKWLAPTLVSAAIAIGIVKGWAVDAGHAITSLGRK